MYTSEFMEQEKAYQEEQEEKNNEIFLNVLNNPEKEITETAFQRELCKQIQPQLLKQNIMRTMKPIINI